MAVSGEAIGGYVILFFLIFGLSATVKFSAFKKQVKNKVGICTGLFLQFVILPLLGFAVVKIFNSSFYSGITLLIVTASPGGSYSNWFCSLFNADLALSVTMTAASTILSMGFLPLNVYIYSKLSYESDVLSSLDWVGLGISLAVVLFSISIGLILSWKIDAPKFRQIANILGNIAGVGIIIYSMVASENVPITGRPWHFYFATPLPIVFGLISSVTISTLANLKKPERVTVAVECCYQNTGIAITSCFAIFEGDELTEALGVPLYYTLVQGILMGFFCLFAWKIGWTKAPKDENFLKVLLNSYQHVNENGDGAGDSDSDSDSVQNTKDPILG